MPAIGPWTGPVPPRQPRLPDRQARRHSPTASRLPDLQMYLHRSRNGRYRHTCWQTKKSNNRDRASRAPPETGAKTCRHQTAWTTPSWHSGAGRARRMTAVPAQYASVPDRAHQPVCHLAIQVPCAAWFRQGQARQAGFLFCARSHHALQHPMRWPASARRRNSDP